MSDPPTVLVVDDEEEVQAVTADMVEDLGHRAVCASNGAEALRRIAADWSIEVLITDIKMPGIHGFELARLARRIRPDLRVIYVTGYSSLIPDKTGETFGPIVQKPFTVARLGAELRAIGA